MKKNELVKKIIGEAIEPYGFEYNNCSDHGRWQFIKIINNDIKQYIVIYKSAYNDSIRLELSTSVQPKSLEMKDICDEPEYNNSFYDYAHIDEFIDVLNIFRVFIIKFGLKKIDEISEPMFLFEPDENMYTELYRHHIEFSQKFIKKNNLKENISIYEAFDIVKCAILFNMEKKLDEFSNIYLLELTSYFCCRLINEFKGELKLNSTNKVYYLNNNQTYDSLKIIMNEWEKSTTNTITDIFNEIVNSANSLEMHSKLFEYNANLSIEFIKKKYDMSLDESIKTIESFSLNCQKRLDDDTKNNILEMISFFCNKIISKYGGKWEWDNKNNICYINDVHNEFHQYDFLSLILNTIYTRDFYIFKFTYDTFIKK